LFFFFFFFYVSSPSTVEFDDQERTTGVVWKNLNPTWNETFEFPVRQEADINITLWDKDLLTSDDFLGEVHISVDSLFDVQVCVLLPGIKKRPSLIQFFLCIDFLNF